MTLVHPCADDDNIIISATTYIRLHKAAQLGDLKTIEAACEDQVDLNQTDKFLKTPLMVAAANGRAHIAHILLRHDGYVHVPITYQLGRHKVVGAIVVGKRMRVAVYVIANEPIQILRGSDHVNS